jgi:hypothetical protein
MQLITLINEIINSTQPVLLVGPSGVGKSHLIQELADKQKLVLYSYNCRRDKTLREGRNKLINWVFLKEPCIVWLEGADDLTIEAQSFLRRSLETYSRAVILILEVRDTAFLADPLRSRCRTFIIERPCMDNRQLPQSYRANKVYSAAQNLAIREKCIYDENDEYTNALCIIKEGRATMLDILRWKKEGIYVNKLVEDAMVELNLKWWPDMPPHSRGKNGWFLLAYIIAKTQGVKRECGYIA